MMVSCQWPWKKTHINYYISLDIPYRYGYIVKPKQPIVGSTDCASWFGHCSQIPWKNNIYQLQGHQVYYIAFDIHMNRPALAMVAPNCQWAPFGWPGLVSWRIEETAYSSDNHGPLWMEVFVSQSMSWRRKNKLLKCCMRNPPLGILAHRNWEWFHGTWILCVSEVMKDTRRSSIIWEYDD